MRRSSTSRPILPTDWTEVLARVQQTLQEADAAAAKRVEALETDPDSGRLRSRLASESAPRLEQMRERVDNLASYIDRAARAVSDADVGLAAGEDSLRSWLQASEAARRKLADWVGRA
jgi:hypothetical protein